MIMLLGKDLGRCHQCGLSSVAYHEIDAGGGNHGFTGTDIALAKAVHGASGTHVGNGLFDAALLGIGQGKG